MLNGILDCPVSVTQPSTYEQRKPQSSVFTFCKSVSLFCLFKKTIIFAACLVPLLGSVGEMALSL